MHSQKLHKHPRHTQCTLMIEQPRRNQLRTLCKKTNLPDLLCRRGSQDMSTQLNLWCLTPFLLHSRCTMTCQSKG